MAAAKEERKPQLLCLHGWRSNSDISNFQLANLGLDKEFDVSHLHGPFEGHKAENNLMAEVSPNKTFYSWLTLSHKDDVQFEDELILSLKKVLLHVLTRGRPYDVVYGFSQGAMIVSLLSSAFVRHGLLRSLKKEVDSKWLKRRFEGGLWRCVISTCASNRQKAWDVCAKRFGFSQMGNKEYLKSGFIQLPSIHFIGGEDIKHKKKSKDVSKMFKTICRKVFVLDMAHEVPMSVRKQYAFIPQEVRNLCETSPPMPDYDSGWSTQKGSFSNDMPTTGSFQSKASTKSEDFASMFLVRSFSASSLNSTDGEDENSRSSFFAKLGRRNSFSADNVDKENGKGWSTSQLGMGRHHSTSSNHSENLDDGRSVGERVRRPSLSSNDGRESEGELSLSGTRSRHFFKSLSMRRLSASSYDSAESGDDENLINKTTYRYTNNRTKLKGGLSRTDSEPLLVRSMSSSSLNSTNGEDENSRSPFFAKLRRGNSFSAADQSADSVDREHGKSWSTFLPGMGRRHSTSSNHSENSDDGRRVGEHLRRPSRHPNNRPKLKGSLSRSYSNVFACGDRPKLKGGFSRSYSDVFACDNEAGGSHRRSSLNSGMSSRRSSMSSYHSTKSNRHPSSASDHENEGEDFEHGKDNRRPRSESEYGSGDNSNKKVKKKHRRQSLVGAFVSPYNSDNDDEEDWNATSDLKSNIRLNRRRSSRKLGNGSTIPPSNNNSESETELSSKPMTQKVPRRQSLTRSIVVKDGPIAKKQVFLFPVHT